MVRERDYNSLGKIVTADMIMKRFKGGWEQLVSMENLHLAFTKARKGKKDRAEVVWFDLELEKELYQLCSELRNGTYRPGDYRQFQIIERKPRTISAAPFRDRVVHHAIINVIEEWLDNRFIFHSYACRKNKGVHRAVDQYQAWAQKNCYIMKLDIQRYFPSIDREILKNQLTRKIKDKKLLNLLFLIIDRYPEQNTSECYFPGDDLLTKLSRPRGLPIGNLTSQILANLYLNDLDHWLNETMGVGHYLRYVDDLYILANDKNYLWQLKKQIDDQLIQLRLQVHPKKVQIQRTTDKVDVLGYKVSRTKRWLRNDNGYRFRRRLRRYAKAFAAGKIDWPDMHPRVASWLGHARHGETNGLVKTIFNEVHFSRSYAPRGNAYGV